jgi:hypothetical protein
MRRSARVFLGLVVPPIAVATISGCGDEPKVTAFNPGVVAIPHALFLPASADEIALGASYFAWVELNKESQEAHTLDLAVWPSRSAALHALAQYRAGGPKTRPRGLGTGWPRTVEKVEAIRTVTLAWYAWPTLADERVVTRALRFSGSSSKRGRDYTALGDPRHDHRCRRLRRGRARALQRPARGRRGRRRADRCDLAKRECGQGLHRLHQGRLRVEADQECDDGQHGELRIFRDLGCGCGCNQKGASLSEWKRIGTRASATSRSQRSNLR